MRKIFVLLVVDIFTILISYLLQLVKQAAIPKQ